MTTAGAGFGSVARVDADHADSLLLGLVLDEASELSKAPGVKAVGLLSLTPFDSLANVGQVLQNDGSSLGSSLNNLFADDVVLISPAAKLFARKALQMTPGRSGALALEYALEPEGFGLQLFPVPLTQKAVIGGDGGTSNPQVYPNDIGGRSDLRSRNINNNMQPEFPFAGNKVCGAGLESCVLESILGNPEGKKLASCNCGNVYSCHLPINPEGMQVVPYGAMKAFRLPDLPPLPLQGESGADGLCGLYSSLNNQVRDQQGIAGSQLVVGGFVEADPVALFGLPSHRADIIEAGGKLLQGLPEDVGLLWGRL